MSKTEKVADHREYFQKLLYVLLGLLAVAYGYSMHFQIDIENLGIVRILETSLTLVIGVLIGSYQILSKQKSGSKDE